MGQGQGEGSRAKTSVTQGHVYAITPYIEPVEQSMIQRMFLLSRLWAKILFDSSASHSFVAASSVDVLSLEVKTLDEPLYVSSPLGTRVRINQICRDCELEISKILITMDLRVRYISDFDVILSVDWLMAHRIVINCDSRRIFSYTSDGICVTFQGEKHDALPQTMHDSRWSGQLMGWLASLTLEEEVRQELDLPQVVCEYEDVFLR